MSAIEQSPAALGGHVERCEDCGHSRIAYNSCRNRHCPKCQGAAGQDRRPAGGRICLPVGYFHVVFTLPAEISPIAYQNKAVVYDLLFRTAAETLLTIAADPKHLGARIGATAVLHSWGSTMTHHPHVHMIVPGGGISLDGTRWVRCKPGFLCAGAGAFPPVTSPHCRHQRCSSAERLVSRLATVQSPASSQHQNSPLRHFRLDFPAAPCIARQNARWTPVTPTAARRDNSLECLLQPRRIEIPLAVFPCPNERNCAEGIKWSAD